MTNMSGSTEFVEKMQQGKMLLPADNKSSFSQTCGLLSQYLKEKGSFGDLGLGMTCNVEQPVNRNGNGNGAPEMLRHAAKTTMNLFPINEKAGHVSNWNVGSRRNIRSMDLFPQQAGFAPKEDVQKNIDSSVSKPACTEPQTAQMTIFYAGQVIVFNDFPADKAMEVMMLASKGSSQIQNVFPSMLAKSHPAFAPNAAKAPTEPNSSIPSGSNALPNFANNLVQECLKPTAQPIANDLPIARRASLHRFLEKRKDRITARAPYQTYPTSATKPADDTRSWLGLAAQSKQ